MATVDDAAHPAAFGPSLDRSGEPWVASFPGLGRVEVSADGGVAVECQPDSVEDVVMRERALRYGWAEPLSLVRQGFQLFGGAGVVPPGGGSSCLMLHGDVHDTALVLLAFVSLGWSVLGDRFVPTRWQEGQLVAYPTDSPVLLSKRRAEKRGISGTKVRSHTDALEIDVPRSDSPADVAGVALLRIARPEDEVLTVLTGHERFEPAVNYQVAGVLGRFTAEGLPAAPPKEVMAEHLRLAAIPAVRLSFSEDALEANLAALVAWWDAL